MKFFPKILIFSFPLLFFLILILALYYFKNFYIPGTIIYLHNEGVYQYQNFGPPKELVKPKRVSSILLSPDGQKVFYTFYTETPERPLFDSLIPEIYNLKTKTTLTLDPNYSYHGARWTNDSNKLIIVEGFPNTPKVYDLKESKFTQIQNDDPILDQLSTPAKPKNWKRTGRYEIIDRVAYSPDGTKVLIDKASEPQNNYDQFKRSIYLFDSETGEERLLIKNGGTPQWAN